MKWYGPEITVRQLLLLAPLTFLLCMLIAPRLAIFFRSIGL